MKNLVVVILGILLIGVLGGYLWQRGARNQVKQDAINDNLTKPLTNNSKTMELNSKSFAKNGDIPVKYTCDGENVNPGLSIAGIPENAKTLVLIMDDPDAPAGTWTHWTVWNIKPAAEEIGENTVPEGSVQGTTSAGSIGYHGPCPPSGVHRYFFKVYALDDELDLPENTTVAQLVAAMASHILDQAEIMGKYSRSE